MQSFSNGSVSGSDFHPRASSRTAACRTCQSSSERARSFSHGSVAGSDFDPRASPCTAAWRTIWPESLVAADFSQSSVSWLRHVKAIHRTPALRSFLTCANSSVSS